MNRVEVQRLWEKAQRRIQAIGRPMAGGVYSPAENGKLLFAGTDLPGAELDRAVRAQAGDCLRNMVVYGEDPDGPEPGEVIAGFAMHMLLWGVELGRASR